MIARAVLGLGGAAIVAFAARRAHALTRGGAIAATVVGACAVAADWSWGILLIAYFIASSAWSRVAVRRTAGADAGITAKGAERDAAQVLANGAMFAGAAVAMLLRPDVRWILLGAGSLASAASDTWASEIGAAFGGRPFSIRSRQRVAAGTSGAVSLAGTLAAIAGTLFVAGMVNWLGWTTSVAVQIAAGGIAGSTIDTVLGATVQACRRCESCGTETERLVHVCGTKTSLVRGWAWLDNDLVNFLSNAAGGLVAVWLSH